MKQSKTPIWKKSMLEKLNFDSICEALEEIEDNGDMNGYDVDEKGYYNEYKEQFDDLSAMAYELESALTGTYDLQENWDDMTVALLGDVYTVLGYDGVEIDFFHLLNYEEELAESEAAKRILKLTKTDMLQLFRRVLNTLMLFYDIKAAHDCLTSIVEELIGNLPQRMWVE